jgi:DNA-directed RNA polymerase specialized sigma24 family protein
MANFYELAVSDGLGAVGSFRKALGDERLLDLVHDLLADRLDAILAADHPRALIVVALQRRAISWRRRPDAAVVAEPVGQQDDTYAADVEEGERRAFVIDARAHLAALPERERLIMVAVGLGTDREELARELGTSRGNVDQIVNRVRKRLAGGGA